MCVGDAEAAMSTEADRVVRIKQCLQKQWGVVVSSLDFQLALLKIMATIDVHELTETEIAAR